MYENQIEDNLKSLDKKQSEEEIQCPAQPKYGRFQSVAESHGCNSVDDFLAQMFGPNAPRAGQNSRL